MQSFEQEIKHFLRSQQLDFTDNSESFKRLDFTVKLAGDWKFHFDAKEKRQRYNLQSWQLLPDQEHHAFIMDDLAARKILAYAPYSGMVVRDNLLGGYYFFSVLDLFLMPKIRVNRPIHKEQPGWKGKWIVDLRNGRKCGTMAEVLAQFSHFIEKREDFFLHILECYGVYQGESIGQRGEVRRPEHWDVDVKETR